MEVPALPADLAEQLDLAFRLVVAAVLGGLIGLERELHQHPAGMRTHLLVSLGSAAFTVLSIAGFEAPAGPNGMIPTDPSRVAAQVVSGIGFLGAGAILKYGTTIKGLTTAASLWATSAVGMAAGAGQWVVAAVGALIVVGSLWPLRAILDRWRRGAGRVVRVRLAMADLARLGSVTGELSNRRVDIADLRIERRGDGHELGLVLLIPPGAVPADVMHALSALPGIDLLDAERAEE
ncbi:MAG TPA: MgtC/SapB family protein [Candidatus Limnocylindrales bacterium]|nr:MgtC/SapB family protein [Candidatus Limnocylindrales bacterium]